MIANILFYFFKGKVLNYHKTMQQHKAKTVLYYCTDELSKLYIQISHAHVTAFRIFSTFMRLPVVRSVLLHLFRK